MKLPHVWYHQSGLFKPNMPELAKQIGRKRDGNGDNQDSVGEGKADFPTTVFPDTHVNTTFLDQINNCEPKSPNFVLRFKSPRNSKMSSKDA